MEFLDAVVLEEGTEEGLVRGHPVELALVGEGEAQKLPLLVPLPPLAVEHGLPGVLQPGEHGGPVGQLYHIGPLPGGGVRRRGRGSGEAELLQEGEELQPYHGGRGLLGVARPFHVVGEVGVHGGVPADGAQVKT